MMSKDDGGPAFPREGYSRDDAPGRRGMSLRDYFAARAICSVLQDPYFSEKADQMGYGEFADEAAEEAYAVADAMLSFRNRRAESAGGGVPLVGESKEREAFEAHAPMNIRRREESPGIYEDTHVQASWCGWQARARGTAKEWIESRRPIGARQDQD
jgi:hypothetical protein